MRKSGIAALLALWCVGAQAAPKSSADRTLAEAAQQRDRGDLEGALATLRAAIAAQPRASSLHRLYQEIAAIARRSGPLVEAEYRLMADRQPDDPLGALLHASATMVAAITTPGFAGPEMVESIERKLARAEAAPETRADSHLLAAELARYREEPAEVQRQLRKALEADPRHPEARVDLLRALAAEAAWSEATALCLDLLDDVPWRLAACGPLFNRGGEQRAPAAAQAQIHARLEKLERGSGDVVVLDALYAFYDAMGEAAGAERVEQKLKRLEPAWRPALGRNPYLAPLEGGELTNQEMEALRALDTLRSESAGDRPRRLEALGRLEVTLKDTPRMRALVLREMSQAARSAEIDDRPRSRELLAQAAELTPDDPSLLNEWAYVSALDGVDLEEALTRVDRALTLLLGRPFSPLEIDPGDTLSSFEIGLSESVGAYLDTRGWLLHELGRLDEAARELSLAVLLSSDGTVHAHLGRVLWKLGQADGAFVHLLRALAVGCEDEEAVEALARRLYDEQHVVPGGLDALVEATRAQLSRDIARSGDGLVSESDAPTVPSRALDDIPTEPHPLLGERIPAITIDGLDGAPLDLRSLRGGVTVVDFWATWCGPCLESMPAMEALAQAYADQGVQVVAVSVDDSADTAKQWFQRWTKKAGGSRMRPAWDGGGAAAAFGIIGIPATFIVAPDGTVVSFHQGFDGDADALRRTVDAVLQASGKGR